MQIGFSNDKKQKGVQKMKQKKYFDKNVCELPHLKEIDCVRLRDASDNNNEMQNGSKRASSIIMLLKHQMAYIFEEIGKIC